MTPVIDTDFWYVRNFENVQGPYSAHEVQRYMLIGSVKPTDMVTTDGELWEPVSQVAHLVPEELIGLIEDEPEPVKQSFWQKLFRL